MQKTNTSKMIKPYQKNKTRTLSIRDFTEYPVPRYKRWGYGSGEEFRESVLKPALTDVSIDKDGNIVLTIDLDGTKGYSSSFLEEAFGGAVREKLDVDRVKFISEDRSLVKEILDYIDEAKTNLASA